MSTPLLLLLACTGPSTQRATRPSPELEAGLIRAAQWVQPALALQTLDGLMAELPQSCPTLVFEGGSGVRESWSACAQDRTRGSVDRYEDGQMAWMDISGLALDGEQLEGSISHRVTGELSTLDWAGTYCEDLDGCTQLDLSWTIVERAENDLTDVLVSGTLYTPALGPVLVEGTYALSPECDHPMDGLLLLQADRTHTLAFGSTCGECGVWTVDGVTVGELCTD